MGLLNFFKGDKKEKGVSFTELQSFLLGESVSKDGLDVFETSLYVNACAEKRANKIASVEWELWKGEKEILEHPLLNLLYKPNRYQDKNEFFRLQSLYKDLSGVCYFVCIPSIKDPKEMFALVPSNVREVWSNGQFLGVEYISEVGKSTKYKDDQVFFIKNFSAKNQTQATPIIKSLMQSIQTENDLSVYQSKALANGGKIGGVVSFPGDISDAQMTEIKNRFSKEHTQAKNSNKLMVLTGGAIFNDLGLTPTELSFIESKKLTRDDILLAFGVPKPLLAITDDVNRANAETALTIFLAETIKPLVDNLKNKLNEFLIPADLELKYKDFVPTDTVAKLALYDNGLRNGWLAINEVRGMEGLDAVKGGEVPLIGFGSVPLGEDYATEEVEEDAEMANEKTEKKTLLLRNPEKRKEYYKGWLKRQSKNEKLLFGVMKKFFQEQKTRAVNTLPKGKSIQKANELLNDNLEIDLLKKTLLPHLTKFVKEGGQDAVKRMKLPVPFKLHPARLSAIDNQVSFLSAEITKTTEKKLKRVLMSGLDEGKGYKEIAEDIEDLFDDMSKGRAMTIARTSTVSTMQSGVYDAYKENLIPIKIWVAVGDEETRDSHFEIDGEERPLDMPFSNGLMYPGDPSGPPEEVINCRCSI